MENVSYPPLVEHLKENWQHYNQLYYEEELKFGMIDRNVLSDWIVQVIEPILIQCSQAIPESLPTTFKAFYSSILKLLGSKHALFYENEYRKAWQMCLLMPHLVARDPQRITNSINTALVSLREYQPEKLHKWLSMMHEVVSQCKSVEDFLNCGRVCAWACGMAHLRSRIKNIYPGLADNIREALSAQTGQGQPEQLLNQRWKTSSFDFSGCAGGFIGYGKGFVQPPRVAEIDGQMVVTDTESCSVLFADAYGTELHKASQYLPEEVYYKSNTKALIRVGGGKIKFNNPFSDVSSCVDLHSTFVLTRESSFYLFIYSYNLG
jgi:hypothetical protein